MPRDETLRTAAATAEINIAQLTALSVEQGLPLSEKGSHLCAFGQGQALFLTLFGAGLVPTLIEKRSLTKAPVDLLYQTHPGVFPSKSVSVEFQDAACLKPVREEQASVGNMNGLSPPFLA